ncbi:hypothetical protein [Thermodesulfovibrio yellowstonii]|uniref:Uncharacterized protein n=1 Tax=Thermodesulfovibrio yellowstonii TaxID=28262 RepID=A0A9W6GG74_9BACT|nr:hypothetical protein [Thermodesulfovibrio islandicus]GLI53368.1 hypothetical protein TISLANDTSLP1_10610 [Thermodesulfovibrio islandicus]
MKEIIKEEIQTLKSTWSDILLPVARGFLTYTLGKTLTIALLTGFNLSALFKDFDLFYILAVLISFIASIYLFLKAYKRVKEEFIKEEKERKEF